MVNARALAAEIAIPNNIKLNSLILYPAVVTWHKITLQALESFDGFIEPSYNITLGEIESVAENGSITPMWFYLCDGSLA
jgi:hypothetical protein